MLLYCLLILIPVTYCHSTKSSKKHDESTVKPIMGWNSWNHFGCNISEALIKETANALVHTGLSKLGYSYINIDDCWQLSRRVKGQSLDADKIRFPSGMKHLGEYIHNLGLKFGIYSSAGFKTCQSFPGSLGMELVDAKTFCEWKVDYLKYDNCYRDYGPPEKRFPPMAASLHTCDRPILYSLCEWGEDNPAVWASEISDSWRISSDIQDSWESIMEITDITAPLWRYSGPKQGWNDPDMLQIGNGGCSTEEYKTHFSLWIFLKSPLLLGTDIRNMHLKSDIFNIISNKEMIAIHQDIFGRQARRVWSDQMDGNGPHQRDNRVIATKCTSGKPQDYEDDPVTQQWDWLENGTIKSKATGHCLHELLLMCGRWSPVHTIADCEAATVWERGLYEGSVVSRSSGRCLEVVYNTMSALAQGKRIQTSDCIGVSISRKSVTQMTPSVTDTMTVTETVTSSKGKYQIRYPNLRTQVSSSYIESDSQPCATVSADVNNDAALSYSYSYDYPSTEDTKTVDFNEHQSWTEPQGRLFNLYQRQCLTVDYDAPPGNQFEIWSTELADGAIAALFLNRGESSLSTNMTWPTLLTRLNVPPRRHVVSYRDMWTHKTEHLSSRHQESSGLSLVIPSHGVAVFKIFICCK